MKAQAVPRSAISLGPFLTLFLLLRPAEFDDNLSWKVSSDTTALAGAAMRRRTKTGEEHWIWPEVVNSGQILKLLMRLRIHSSRNRARCQGPTLPPGCVMVVRYASR